MLLNLVGRGPVRHKPDSPRLQKIVSGYKNICLCSLAGYKKRLTFLRHAQRNNNTISSVCVCIYIYVCVCVCRARQIA